MTPFYSNGKLLITAEYLVLDGGKALALPTTFGQSLHIAPRKTSGFIWKSLDDHQNTWFSCTFYKDSNKFKSDSTDAFTMRLLSILNSAKDLNPIFLNEDHGLEITTKLDFPKNWGLGTSSTLINNIANWAQINPYKLLEHTFGGSGYDIACASNNTPITYQLQDKQPLITPVTFRPRFKEHIYFVHLNEKQNSREGIARYKSNKFQTDEAITAINTITDNLIACESLSEFNLLVEAHETLISDIIKLPTVKSRLFPDFKGSIKSLGAWGGDFVMVTSETDPSSYFKHKGYHTILSYNAMIL